MRRLLAPLIGIPVGFTLAILVALCARPDGGRSPPARIAAHPPQHAAALPKIGPFPPNRLRPPAEATTQASGTGFFVGPGTAITAAHVVKECRSIMLVSQYFPPTEATLVTVDADNDIALLHSVVPAPAHLAIAGPAAPPTRALVYGFPATAARDVPDTTWATVVNASLVNASLVNASLVNASLVNNSRGHGPVLEKDPRILLWMQNRDIAQGYSGGPILNPANGQVLGIVRALIDPQRAAAAYGIVTPDLSIGPGIAPLRAILAQHGAGAADPDTTDDIFTRARKATVHVFCWQ